MKKALFTLVLLSGLTFLMSFTEKPKEMVLAENLRNSDYCDGWEDGYCEGWKDVKGQYAICPITPICPIPDINCYEGYKCGYNRGFKAGIRAANND